jgi:hypothetical protein
MLEGKDYMITAPGHHLMITRAMSDKDARRIARENFGVLKLPKGTHIEVYTESDWN